MTAREAPFAETGELTGASMPLALDHEEPAINPARLMRDLTPRSRVVRAMERVMAEPERRREQTPETNEGAAPNRRDGSAVPKYERLKGTTGEASTHTGRDEPASPARSKDSPWMGGG
jgi:hypothetical protein